MISLELLPSAAPPGTKWVPIKTDSPVRTLEALRDEMQSWTGPRLAHGDLVRVVSPAGERLLVTDTSGALHDVLGLTASMWEREDATAVDLIRLAEGAPPRQFAWCALALARAVLILANDSRARMAVEAAEGFLRGECSRDALRAVAMEAAGAWSGAAASWAAWTAETRETYAPQTAQRRTEKTAMWATSDAPSPSRAHADIVRKFLPLPGVACARAGLPWPLPEVTT